jgi:hypothetical protein
MLEFVSMGRSNGITLQRMLRGTAAAFAMGVALWVTSIQVMAETSATGKIPALAGNGLGWISVGGFLDPPPGTGHGPMKQDPAHPFHGNLDGPGQVTPTIGNVNDPVLKPWAAAQMQVSNEEVLTDKRGLPFSAQGRCYPGGVPGQLLYPIEPMYFIQMPKQVWMIWQRDHMVRRIYLTDQHSETVKPSWFGESIGRYENGELVIDTVGLSTNLSFIDNFRTPHSDKEHVVERYKISADGNMLEASVTVEDPDAFNALLHMIKRWRRAANPGLETVCAENNGDHFSKNLFPIPEAKTPDF